MFETFYGLVNRTEIVTLINASITNTKGNNVQYTKIVADSMIIDSKPISNVGNFSHSFLVIDGECDYLSLP